MNSGVWVTILFMRLAMISILKSIGRFLPDLILCCMYRDDQSLHHNQSASYFLLSGFSKTIGCLLFVYSVPRFLPHCIRRLGWSGCLEVRNVPIAFLIKSKLEYLMDAEFLRFHIIVIITFGHPQKLTMERSNHPANESMELMNFWQLGWKDRTIDVVVR